MEIMITNLAQMQIDNECFTHTAPPYPAFHPYTPSTPHPQRGFECAFVTLKLWGSALGSEKEMSKLEP